MKHFLLLALLIPTLAVAQTGGAWLDAPLASWNRAGADVSSPARKPSQPDELLKRCSLTAPPATAASKAVAAAGWVPFLHQDRAISRGDIEIVAALGDTSSACEPASFNLFVFVGGRFAGTLAPAPMTTGRDGVIGAVRLAANDSLTAEFARYAAGDSDCCPSTRVRVTYRLERSPSPTVSPANVQILR